MKTKLIIDGNDVYEIDEECLRCKDQARQEQRKRQDGNEKFAEKTDWEFFLP